MKLLQEFKQFAMKGNVVDMAVGVIIGAAFGKIVSSIVDDIIMPPIGLLIGGVDFTDLRITLKQATTLNGEEIAAVTINYGNFIQTLLDFIILALAVFLMVKALNTTKRKQQQEKPEPPKTPEHIKLLEEIRDLLKHNKTTLQ